MSLTKNQLIHLNQTGEQLKDAFKKIIKQFPISAQSITGMAKWLPANKSTCQRILNAINKSQDGLEVIDYVPGLEGINQFIQQIEKKSINTQNLDELKKSINHFKSDIQQFSRSHSELKRSLEKTKTTSSNTEKSTREKNRQILHEASVALLGESIDLTLATYIVTPNLYRTQFQHEIALIYKKKINATSQIRPFMQPYSYNKIPQIKKPRIINHKTRAADDTFDLGIIEEYSSGSIIDGYSGYSKEHSSMVFNNSDYTNFPFDTAFLFNNPDEIENPLKGNKKITNHSISVRSPTQKLILLVFVDKQFDMRSSVSVVCHASNLQIEQTPLSYDKLCLDRLPEFPDLKLINPLKPLKETIGLGNHEQLVRYLFDYSQLNRSHFVGYMIEVNYPIWSSTYRIYFEYL